MRRFLAVFYPGRRVPADHPHHARRRDQFKTEGKVLQQPGLAGGLRQAPAGDENENLPAITHGREGRTSSRSTSLANQTKPPARYTEATLLSAMEGAGKLVEDDELREAMERKGPRHAGHARGDHRRPDPRGVRAPQRPRAGADAQGVLAAVRAARAAASPSSPRPS